MTHSLDFVGLNKKLFLLRHLIAGNKEFSRREQHYQGTQAEPSEDWEKYAARLRYMVSNDLIEVAAKFRVMKDTASLQVSAASMRELDCSCLESGSIGTVLEGEVDLSLRESCNKIIHATKFQLIFQNARSAVPRHVYSYWNGVCQFSGSQARKNWRVALDVYRWADAMDYFLEELSGNVNR